MLHSNVPYKRHIFVCTHNANGEKPSCADANSPELFSRLRAIAKDKGLHPKIRVAQAKCLGQCQSGANVMVYPENVWISNLTVKDADSIAQQYILGK